MLATICLRKYPKRFFFLKAFEAHKHSSTRCLGNFSHHQIQFKNKQTAHEKGWKPVNYQIKGFSNTFNTSIRDPNRFDFIWSVGLLSDSYLRNHSLTVLLSPTHKGLEKGRRSRKKLIVRIVFTKYNIAFKANEIRFVFCWWRISFRSFQSLSKLTILQIFHFTTIGSN